MNVNKIYIGIIWSRSIAAGIERAGDPSRIDWAGEADKERTGGAGESDGDPSGVPSSDQLVETDRLLEEGLFFSAASSWL